MTQSRPEPKVIVEAVKNIILNAQLESRLRNS